MDIFQRFNRKSIDDRQIDTLIGLSKGLLADGKVDQCEAEYLYTWLIQSRQTTDNPVIINLLNRVDVMLKDGVLDQEESAELLSLLHKLTGEKSEVGELAKATSLPVNEPSPTIIFQDNQFLFTGTCVYGTRKDCQAAIERLGGINAKSVTKKLNYLVLGTYVTDSWIHESYGRKIEKAMQYRDEGVPITIITEEHWVNEGNLSQ
ncbi:MAG: BRCT domain-containing protein [Gammaproteobacteria bacterium]|nr:BRCT domain-containing protein [Gammaproteobacteria bacterium]